MVLSIFLVKTQEQQLCIKYHPARSNANENLLKEEVVDAYARLEKVIETYFVCW
jgi:hypothetical protein